MQTNGRFYHVSFVITLVPVTYFWLVFCWLNYGVAWRCSREACKGRVLVKRCRASGPTVKTHRDFGLGATGPRLLALPGPFKTMARTDPTVEKRLMRAAGTGELQFIEGTMNANMYCDILKQSMIPSLQRLGRRAVFQHDNDYCLAKEMRVKVMDWPSMSPDLNPIKSLWGIFKLKVEERKVCNIHQFQYDVMEEWKRSPVAICEDLVNSMPKRVKAVLENNSGHTKYWHIGHNFDTFT